MYIYCRRWNAQVQKAAEEQRQQHEIQLQKEAQEKKRLYEESMRNGDTTVCLHFELCVCGTTVTDCDVVCEGVGQFRHSVHFFVSGCQGIDAGNPHVQVLELCCW